ncbi:Ribonucleases P/MRP protein subunit pop1 [Exophiala xenobiotica]|nr:Ribonucleases P/MRP protein subunit pop1 [Exophiala xenobiotica]
MAPPPPSAGQKRKVASDRHANASQAHKRQKFYDARVIPVQPAKAALSTNGELNVASFIKAREFEIGALERSMQKVKKTLNTRAFQQVPRHMRRRTASHNAKKVPKRLRKRAKREMKEDNTPTVTKRTRTPSRRLRLRLGTAKLIKQLNQKRKTVRQKKKEAVSNAKQSDPENHVSSTRISRLKKNTLVEAPRATVKYKKRQVNKTWLPTHLWHTKRAHMTRPTEPLWRMAIPMSPTEKSYRPSHRAAGTHGCIAWDTSYMSTVACQGTKSGLESLLKAFGFSPQNHSSSLQKKWTAGTRFAEGWIYERDNPREAIAPVKIIWCIQSEKKVSCGEAVQSEDRMNVDENDQAPASVSQAQAKGKARLNHRILIRIHPSTFHQFWQELLKVAKMQKPQVLVEDLRFEIGSIDIQGPGSTESLLGVLKPFPDTNDSIAAVWTSLAGLNNPAALPQNALLAFDIVDPRLNHPPTQVRISQSSDTSQLEEVLVAWPVDEKLISSRLSSHKERWQVSNSLPSQKAINRRRALAQPGQTPAISAKDPRIPVVIIASRSEDRYNSKASNPQGTWTILLPWACVDPVWRSLMYYPLSSGGTPRFGGLKQKQQLAFEQKIRWFPGDLPGTEAGRAWERTESEKRFDEWIRRPPKNRTAWDRVDLGLGRHGEVGQGWTCDWEFLFESSKEVVDQDFKPGSVHTKAKPDQPKPLLLTQRQRKAAKAEAQREARAKEDPARRRNTSSPESDEEEDIRPPTPIAEPQYTQLSDGAGISLLKNLPSTKLPSVPALMTIRIILLDKGTPAPAARIYRLPTLPKPAAKPTNVTATTETKLASQDQDQPQSWSTEPPPAQHPPATSTTDSSAFSSTNVIRDLRTRWLALDTKSDSISNSKPRVPKQMTNKFGLSRQQHVYPRESLARINVLPKHAPQEIVDKFGPNSAFGRGDGEMPKEKPKMTQNKKRGGGGKESDPSDKPTTAAKEHHAASKKNANEAEAGYLDPDDGPAPSSAPMQEFQKLLNASPPEDEWSKHPPCPDVCDLIGFVTSGGYNLAEGRGTAVGSVWAQRLVEGWKQEDQKDGDGANKTNPHTHMDRQRRLCIVRNAGESIGRLGIWEVCG